MKNISQRPKSKNKAIIFDKNLKQEKVTSTRVIVILASLLYILHSIMDYFGIPNEDLIILVSTRIVNLVVYGIILLLTFKKSFQKHYNKILIFGYLYSGFTICIAIYISQENDYSYNLYFAALLVLMFTSFTWSYLPFKYTLSMSACFIFAYGFIKVFFHKHTITDFDSVQFLILISHIFYLCSVVFVASIAQFVKENLIYKNIKLQEELEVIVKAKTKEARKHAKLANIDALTGIPNRRYITENLNRALSEAERANTQLTLVFIDLNGFKTINDTYGHDSGDKVLEITSKRLLQTIRKEDYLARLGGDEFLIGMKTNCFSDQFIKILCKKLIANISAPIAFNGHKLQVGTSIGIARYPKDGKSIEALIKVADKRMYVDKQLCKKGKSAPPLSHSLL